ncbi:nicastrin [Nilaparvata lugens]|uniref:nicastrin n=1 Tax=Nilaparvata lugens TaxID=108931 RepID=UPI00193E4156|nr:nicastrin [Nilaparvata lugens]
MKSCFLKFNQPFDDSQMHKSLCSLQMKSHMHAAVDTATCIRRSNSITFVFNPLSYCDGMGDKNIISTLEPIKKPENRSILLFSTRLDTASMFDGVMLGAMSTMTGLVTFLATAKLLSSILPANSSLERNVMFAMFNGEMYDYIGSGRTVYDIMQKTFPKESNPINFEHIGLMVDVSQMSKSPKLFCHTKRMNNEVDLLTKEFCRSLEMDAVKPVTVASEVDDELPPSSVHPFLKRDKNIPAVVLANHGKEYINRYYNGLMDNASNIEYRYYNSSAIPEESVQAVLAKISTSLAKSLYAWVTRKNYTGPEAVKPDIIDELLYCYLESRNCKIFKQSVAPEEKLTADLTPLYVGVYKSPNTITKLTALTHVYFTGRNVNISESHCKSSDDDYSYYWISGQSGKGECKQTTVQLLKALSPAFEIEGYDWTSREYSTWSESVWQEMSLRMFLKPSRQQEMVTLVVGLVTLVLSFIVVYWLKSQAHLLFQIEVGVAC